jgi:hypothetical protein
MPDQRKYPFRLRIFGILRFLLERFEKGEAPDRTGACAFYNRIAISRSPASGIEI